MTEIKKERYRRIRGLILKFLAHQHPGPLDIREIHALLDDSKFSITLEELKSHLSYLAERKDPLIQIEKRTPGGVTMEMVRITGDGLNVLDKFTKDVGVNVEF
jgi:hypothetical protein